jgi:hypothetical protein
MLVRAHITPKRTFQATGWHLICEARLGARRVGQQLNQSGHDGQTQDEPDERPPKMNVLERAGDGFDARSRWAAVARLVRDASKRAGRMLLGRDDRQVAGAASRIPP